MSKNKKSRKFRKPSIIDLFLVLNPDYIIPLHQFGKPYEQGLNMRKDDYSYVEGKWVAVWNGRDPRLLLNTLIDSLSRGEGKKGHKAHPHKANDKGK